MDQNEANDRAARGAALLDRDCAGWLRLIALATLDMADERLCILGQAYAYDAAEDEPCNCCDETTAGYAWGYAELGNPGNEFGFNASFSDYPLLDTAWKALITARRSGLYAPLVEAGWLLTRDSLSMISPAGVLAHLTNVPQPGQ